MSNNYLRAYAMFKMLADNSYASAKGFGILAKDAQDKAIAAGESVPAVVDVVGKQYMVDVDPLPDGRYTALDLDPPWAVTKQHTDEVRQ